MLKRTLVIIFLCELSIAIPAFAQKETGAIEGRINDNEGQPIPGVTVTASSASLIGGSANTFSDPDGTYRFPVLAPGLYEVKAELNGFQTVIRKEIRLSLGVTLTADFTLELVQVSETIQVSGRPPLIDMSTTTVSHIVPEEIVSNLPRADRIQNLMALTPGVSDDLVAYGANGPKENNIWVDGVSVSDPRRGDLIISFSQNWIEQVQVSGIGAPAEYGGFTGVTANFITRSGGNQFHGLFETFFQNQNLTSTNVPNPAPEFPFTTYDITAQLGGPILHDKLWFFSGFQYPRKETQPFGFPGTVVDGQTRWLNKLTYRLNKNNTLEGFAHWNHRNVENLDAGPLILPEATRTQKDPQASWNATWISLWSPQTTFEGRVGGFYSDRKDIEDQPDLPGHIDVATGITSVNAAGREQRKRVRFQMNAAVSHHADNFLHGGHDFRFGTEFERSDVRTTTFYNGGMVYFDVNKLPYFRYVTEGYDFESANHRLSTYVQDDWNITDRLTASLGVRWDHNRGLTDRGVVYATDPVAPRLGIVWKLDEKNETVLKVHYGDYYEALLEANYFRLNDGLTPFIFEIFDRGNWVEIDRFPPPHLTVSENLKQPYVRQFSAGIDRVLPGGIPFGAHYIYRRWNNIYFNVPVAGFEPVPFLNPIDGEIITVFRRTGDATILFTNPPGLYRRYDGIELFVNKQFANRLSFSGSVVYSRLQGNAQVVSGMDLFGINPNTQVNFPGNLTIDRPLSWKLAGTYPLPWGFNAGWYFRHESGDTWTATIFVPFATTPFQRVLGEPAGSRQLPSRNLLDLRFEKQFPVYSGQLRFTIDVFNVFNSATALAVDDAFESPNFGRPLAFNAPREVRLGIRYTF